uniref:Uncharacterized protein n=1 Tax=Arundo donax TaxID=35708 RepID=A0A0A9DBA7_ARUDO
MYQNSFTIPSAMAVFSWLASLLLIVELGLVVNPIQPPSWPRRKVLVLEFAERFLQLIFFFWSTFTTIGCKTYTITKQDSDLTIYKEMVILGN